MGAGRGAVLYTSRGERQFASKAERLAFGDRVADLLVRIGRALPADIGFLISKGGITSNDTLSKALALRTARVLGQVHAGCSVVRCPEDHPRFPNLPVVIFPGNVGGDEALTEVYQTLIAPLLYSERCTSRFKASRCGAIAIGHSIRELSRLKGCNHHFVGCEN